MQPSESNAPGKIWINGINSLRFVLALLVLLSHFYNVPGAVMQQSENELIKTAGKLVSMAFNGTAAVIAFFIISGFVIHISGNQAAKDWKGFLLKRYLRILIPLAAISIIGYKFNNPEKGIVWSLVCELIYYTIYPVIKHFKVKWNTVWLCSFLVSWVCILVFAWNDVAAFIHQSTRGYSGYYWQTGIFITWLIGLPCWLLGVVLAEQMTGRKKPAFTMVLFLRFLVLFTSILLNAAKLNFHLSFIISMNLFALLLFAWLSAEINYYKQHRSVPILEYAGRFSYTLYICHPLMYILLGKFLPFNIYTYPLFILFTICLAWLLYLLIEKPAHKFARKITAVSIK